MHMRIMAGLGGLMLFGLLPTAAQEGKIELTKVKYEGLKEAVLRHRGQVVLVDFWGEF